MEPLGQTLADTPTELVTQLLEDTVTEQPAQISADPPCDDPVPPCAPACTAFYRYLHSSFNEVLHGSQYRLLLSLSHLVHAVVAISPGLPVHRIGLLPRAAS